MHLSVLLLQSSGRSKLDVNALLKYAEAAHQRGATDQAEAMARDLENTRAELAAVRLNLDKAHSDQSKVHF